jgi:hypothetical protein
MIYCCNDETFSYNAKLNMLWALHSRNKKCFQSCLIADDIIFFLFFSISIGLNADVMHVPLCGPSIKPNTIMCIILYILYILCSALNYTWNSILFIHWWSTWVQHYWHEWHDCICQELQVPLFGIVFTSILSHDCKNRAQLITKTFAITIKCTKSLGQYSF